MRNNYMYYNKVVYKRNTIQPVTPTSFPFTAAIGLCIRTRYIKSVLAAHSIIRNDKFDLATIPFVLFVGRQFIVHVLLYCAFVIE